MKDGIDIKALANVVNSQLERAGWYTPSSMPGARWSPASEGDFQLLQLAAQLSIAESLGDIAFELSQLRDATEQLTRR